MIGLVNVDLLLSGFERLLTEKIRINPGLSFTQAEGISLILIILGVTGVLAKVTSE